MTRPRRTITCARCGQERLHQARGLCDHCYRGAVQKGNLGDYQPIGRGAKKKPGTPDTRRLIVCQACGEERRHQARGLCSACYEAARKAGNLEQYAPTPQIRSAEEAAAHDPNLAAFLRERRRRISRRDRLATINTRRRTAA